MIDAAENGDETVYATGGFIRTRPFIERDIRLAVAALRAAARDPVFIPAHPKSELARAGYSGLVIEPSCNLGAEGCREKH